MDPNNLTPFLPDFLKAARENVSTLQQLVDGLQKNPRDTSALEKAHIDAHSLKGECKAMGFVKTGELARLLEFYFKAMQNGEVTLTSDSSQLLLGVCKAIESSLTSIEKTGNEDDSVNVFSEFSSKTGIS